MRANGQWIIVKCEQNRTASGIILDPTKNRGTIVSKGEETSNRLEVGEDIIFGNGIDFNHEGEDYVVVHRNDVYVIL